MKVHRQKILLASLLACFGISVRAQTTDDSRHDSQIWPDVTVTVRLDEKLSLIFFGTVRLGRNDAAFISRQAGIGLSRRFNQRFTGGVHYRFVENEMRPNRLTTEHRIFADLTPGAALKFGFNISDRNRIEWRNINDRVSWRYRNRLQFERPFSVGERRITPYVAGESMYDTRFSAWTRTQAFIGARVPIAKHVTFDGFYMRQWDARARPGFLNVVGAFWRLEF